MKSTISKQHCNNNLPFPKLMESASGLVVLFQSEDCGVVVNSNASYYPVGCLKNGWNMSIFQDFNGSVCLENDK